MPESVTLQLAGTLARLRPEDMPPHVLDATRRTVLDWLGSALAGSLEAPARMGQRVAGGFGASEEATVFRVGDGHRQPLGGVRQWHRIAHSGTGRRAQGFHAARRRADYSGRAGGGGAGALGRGAVSCWRWPRATKRLCASAKP